MRAIKTLELWAQNFLNRRPEHYVFPSEKCGGVGQEDSFGFTTGAKVYNSDPTKPIGDVKEAWEATRRRTRRHCPLCRTGILADKPKPHSGHACIDCQSETPELPIGLVGIRFHDLRHTAVGRMIAARVPLPKIAKVVGWSQSTMAKMAARYGHFGTEDLRDAVEALEVMPPLNFEAGTQASHQTGNRTGDVDLVN